MKYYITSNNYHTEERITKKGKVYDIRFRIITEDGIEKHKRLSGFKNKTLAKQGYLDFVEKYCELLKNTPIARLKKATTTNETPTIAELSKLYFSSIRNQIKDSTIYEKQKIFDLVILPHFADCQLKDLTKPTLLAWQDEMWAMKNPRTNEYYSYKYLSKLRTYFSAFLSWCADRYEGFTNHIPSVKKPKRRTSQKEMEFWTREEFEKFISVVDDNTYKTLFCTLFFTGRRKGEVLALTHSDIKKDSISFTKSLTRKTLTDAPYEITTTKTEKVASTPICTPLKNILKEYDAPQGKFFFGGDYPLTDNTIRRRFDEWCKVADVKRIRIHDLRHSFVSMCIHLGSSLLTVADLIGDTLPVVTKTYAHLYEEDKQKIISKIV